MKLLLAVALAVPLAFSGCFEICELRGSCFAMVSVDAYRDYAPATHESVRQALVATGFNVTQADPYLQGTGGPLEEHVGTVRVYGAGPGPQGPGVVVPDDKMRVCLMFGLWTHHNSMEGAQEAADAHEAKVSAAAAEVFQEFETRVGRTATDPIVWGAMVHDQGSGKISKSGCSV